MHMDMFTLYNASIEVLAVNLNSEVGSLAQLLVLYPQLYSNPCCLAAFVPCKPPTTQSKYDFTYRTKSTHFKKVQMHL